MKSRSRQVPRHKERDPAPAGPRNPSQKLVVLTIAALVTAGLLLLLPRAHFFVPQPSLPEPPALPERPPIAVFALPPLGPQAAPAELKQAAIRVADELTQVYPSDPDAHAVGARLQDDLGDSLAAKAAWRRCLDLDPRSATAHFQLGLIADREGGFSEAAEQFAQAAALAPADPIAPARQADVLMKSGQVQKAASILEKLAAGPAVLDKALLTLGLAYLQLNELDKAQQTLERLIRIDPNEGRAHYALAKVLAKRGLHDKAQEHLDKFRSLTTVDLDEQAEHKRQYVDEMAMRQLVARTLVAAGHVFHRHEELLAAEQRWREAADWAPQDTESRYGLLRLYEEQGRVDEQLKICQSLCQIDPKNPDHWLFMGLLYSRVNRPDEAVAALERAQQLAPGNAKYRQVLDALKQGN